MEKEEILLEVGINEEQFNVQGLEWNILNEIFEDYNTDKNLSNCEIKVEELSRIFRKYKGVHSVTYRVKNGNNLIKKIIKKRIEYPERVINKNNYRTEITDLLGIRLLHLFKDEWEAIHNQIIEDGWKLVETPIIYKREGDYDICEKKGVEEFQKKIHENGYRSIHYLIEEKTGNKNYIIELQTRTIFEEAWSQIDHLYKYRKKGKDKPDFINNDLLLTLNRIIGTADEIGGLIKKIKTAEEINKVDRNSDLFDEKLAQLIKLRIDQKDKFSKESTDAENDANEKFVTETLNLKKEIEEIVTNSINSKLSNNQEK